MPMALWPPLLLLLVVAAVAAAAAADPMCPDGVCSSTINTTGSDANSTTTTSSPETTFLPTIAPLETTTMKESTTEMPTTVTNATPTTTTSSSRNGKGRAMSDTNDTIKGSLEDLNLDDIDMDILDMKNSTSTQSTTNRTNIESINKIVNSTSSSTQGGCISDGVHYVVGDVFNRGCEETCKCETSGEIKCTARCSTPFQRKGRGAMDEFCVEKDVTDPCCAILVCTQHEEPSEESCHYKNVTLKQGESHNDGCESICLCGDGGVINCKPRCVPTKKPEDSDRCLTLPDPTDPCCMVVRCDVTLSDHESDSSDSSSGFAGLQVLSAEAVNSTSVRLQIVPESASSNISLESSLNRGLSWQTQPGRGLIATDLPPGKLVYLRVKNAAGRYSNQVEVLLPEEPLAASGESGCTYKGTKYQFGSEFHDGCEAYCVCLNVGVQCANIECPTQLGLEVIDPHCTEWVVEPADFVANPPECCPKNVTCRSNGSCIHEGKRYDNWQEVSAGCERRCYCENGTVTCQEACPPIPATPPAGLSCPPTMAILGLMPGDQCCKIWMCPQDHEGPLPPPRPSPDPGLTTFRPTPGPDRPKTAIKPSHLPGPVNPDGLQIPPADERPDWKPVTKTTTPRLPGPISLDDLQSSLNAKTQKNDPSENLEKPILPGPINLDHVKPQTRPGEDLQTSHVTKPPEWVKPHSDKKPVTSPKGGKPQVIKPVRPETDEDDTVPPPGPWSPMYHPPNIVHVEGGPPQGDLHAILHQLQTQGVLPEQIAVHQPHPSTAFDPRVQPRPPTRPEDFLAHIHRLNLLHPAPTAVAGPPLQSSLPAQPPVGNGSHSGFDETFRHPGLGPAAEDLIVEIVEALDPTTVRLVFSVPSILIGLHGRVELRYTPDRLNEDPMTWEQQIHAPPSDLIATPRLEFVLGGLLPDTTYKLRIALIMRDVHNSPVSSVISVRTPAQKTTSLPPTIPIDSQLTAVEVNATWARMTWRKLSDAELQLVDGVQLRYKEYDAKLYQDTPLIHRAVTEYTLEDLKPQTPYEVRVFFIPFHGQTTELQADQSLEFTTTQILDQYKFDVELSVHHVKSSSVELSWSGVPYPEDKYVNIFRAIYQSDGGKEDVSTFKVAKRDSQPRTVVDNLKPGTRYRLWLEVYLTNGKIKKSNVQDFITKPGTVPSVGESLQGKLAAGVGGITDNNHSHADYYNSLVGVSILAALAILVAVVLVLVLLRRRHRGHHKAAITTGHPGPNSGPIPAARNTQAAAYDNPSYKVDIQQETMDL